MCNDSKKTTTSSSTAVTTPTNPQWIQDYGSAFGGQVNGLIGTDASKYVAPASTLQNTAFGSAGLLGSDWKGALQTAQGAVTGLLNPTSHTAALPTAPTTTTYGAAPAAGVSGYTANGYGADTLGTGAQIAPTSSASASTIRDLISNGGLDAYMNPYLGSVVKSTLADFDQDAGTKQAAARAYQAKTGATGGSGNAIFTAGLLADQGRARASTESGLLSAGYDKATALAGSDADRLTGVSEFNAGQSNARAQAQANLDQATMTGDQNAINEARAQLAQAQNAEAAQAAGARNTSLLDMAGRTDAASAAGASADNARQGLLYTTGAQNSEFNAGQADGADTRALSAAGLLGQLGSTAGDQARGDVTSLLTAGDTERTIDADQRTAQLNLLQLLQQLGGYSPSVYAGQTSNTNGTNTESLNPGFLDNLLTISKIGQNIGSTFSKTGVPK